MRLHESDVQGALPAGALARGPWRGPGASLRLCRTTLRRLLVHSPGQSRYVVHIPSPADPAAEG